MTFDLVALQNMKTAAEAVFNNSLQNQSVQLSDPDKDPLNSTTVVTVVEHLHDVMTAVKEVFTETEWHLRWQKLARRSHCHHLRPALLFPPSHRSAFFHNPALQTRSFLMLGVISSHASSNVITRTLKVMEEVRWLPW